MSINDLFFLLPSKAEFLRSFSNNDQLSNQANILWRNFDQLGIVFMIISIMIGIMVSASYYTWYNEMPGRHYKIKHWAWFWAISFVASLVFMYCLECILIDTKLNFGVSSLYALCALSGAIYSFGIYFVVSFIWCNCFKTNAYKFLQIKSLVKQ